MLSSLGSIFMVFVILGAVSCCKDKKSVMKFNSYRACTPQLQGSPQIWGSIRTPATQQAKSYVHFTEAQFFGVISTTTTCEHMTCNSYVSCTLSMGLDEPQHVSQWLSRVYKTLYSLRRGKAFSMLAQRLERL